MIIKNLHLIYSECLDDKAQDLMFKTFKDFHKWIFENGLPEDFQLDNPKGETLIRYRNEGTYTKLHYEHEVPGSIIFEICNQEARLRQEE